MLGARRGRVAQHDEDEVRRGERERNPVHLENALCNGLPGSGEVVRVQGPLPVDDYSGRGGELDDVEDREEDVRRPVEEGQREQSRTDGGRERIDARLRTDLRELS